MSDPFRLVVGLSGASGVIYGIRLLEILAAEPGIETHLVMSPAARQTIQLETSWDPRDVEALADHRYRFGDIAASLSSGSFPIDAMAVVPCSMGTLSAIALSSSDNLLERAADVTLKERRRLVVAPREAPLHLGHLRLMVQLTEMGAVVCPPAPGFYSRPTTIEQLIDHTVSRLLDVIGITLRKPLAPRWSGPTDRRGPGNEEAPERGHKPESTPDVALEAVVDDNDRDNTGTADAESTEGEEVAYGGGFQQGGGMVEPDEFADGGTDAGLPNDALAEGLGRQDAQRAPGAAGTVDPNAAPDANDTGARIGDVAGYEGSDRVVGLDPAVAGEEGDEAS